MKKVINVLTFPGTNCQEETSRSLRNAGFSSRPMRWNENPKEIEACDGLVIAGGFSFEDRGRSGVIAASDPIAKSITKMAHAGKPILGICNGAQILVETGLVPGFHDGVIEMALSRNRRQDKTGILGSGFYHAFISVQPTGKKCAWTNFEGVLKMPISHAEGRFIGNKETIDAVIKNGQNALTYCDEKGNVDPHFPVNPNGSMHNLAAVCNPQGNVMAMMPHPERIAGGQKIFESLHTFFNNGSKVLSPKEIPARPKKMTIGIRKQYPVELFVSLKITDNTAKTMEIALERVLGEKNRGLSRTVYWGIDSEKKPQEIMQVIIDSEEFFNENKERALFRVGEKFYQVRNRKTVECDERIPAPCEIIAHEKDDILGEEKAENLQKHQNFSARIVSGILWGCTQQIDTQKIIDTTLLGNPISWELFE